MKQLKLVNQNQKCKGTILKQFIFTILMALSSVAYASDPSLEPKKAMEALAKVDCAKSLSECRYYAAVEYVAFFSGCRAVLGKYEGRKIPDEDWKESTDILNNWNIWKDEKLHNAVMKAHNPLKDRLTKDITAYLFRIPAQEAFMECERIAIVKDNKEPEHMSDILQSTLNYENWRKSLGDK
jgi:hypothetical protein